jgi:hypothetical protein
MRCHSLVSRVGLCSAYSCSRAKQVFLISTSVTSNGGFCYYWPWLGYVPNPQKLPVLNYVNCSCHLACLQSWFLSSVLVPAWSDTTSRELRIYIFLQKFLSLLSYNNHKQTGHLRNHVSWYVEMARFLLCQNCKHLQRFQVFAMVVMCSGIWLGQWNVIER